MPRGFTEDTRAMPSRPSSPWLRPEKPLEPIRSETEIRDRELLRLQGLQMLLERVAGAPLADVAAKYRLKARTADERMSEAWKDGVLKELEGSLFAELAPMAMAVYEAQLKLGSLDAARDILSAIGLMKRPGQTVKIQPILPAQAPPVTSLDDYRLQRQSRRYSGKPDPIPGRRLITPGTPDVPQ